MSPRPWTLVAELTYACPLRCAYCSNPVSASLGPALSTADWRRVLREAEQLGVVHAHFTGGEPLLHDELETLIEQARDVGLYCSLVTSGFPLTRDRLERLVSAGLEHVQLSIQSTRGDVARRLAGVDLVAHKQHVASWVQELGLSLTLNVVLTRYNIEELDAFVELAERIQPDRLELAHAQYLGWALENRDQLLPSVAQLASARAATERAKSRVGRRFDIVAVLPDYHADRPRACMGGWANQYLVVTPDGLLLPCQAARGVAGLAFDDVRGAPLARLWESSAALQHFRGSSWMKEPCSSCEHRERDFGGCRCQAHALLGDGAAGDPACSLTPSHELVRRARLAATSRLAPLQLRSFPRPPTKAESP